MPQRSRRCNGATAVKVVCVLAVSLTLFAAAPPAQARSNRRVAEDLVNEERARAGVQGLWRDDFLTTYAQGWADEMAAGEFVAHNPRLVEIWDGRSILGENIGWGWSIEEIHGGFLRSPSHYANIVEPAYSRIGVGVAYGPDGSRYIAILFQS